MKGIDPAFDRSAYLRSLRGCGSPLGPPIAKNEVQYRVVDASLDGGSPVAGSDLTEQYIRVLQHIGVRPVSASETGGFLEEVDFAVLNVPQYDTRWFAHPTKNPTRKSALRQTADLLMASGFGRLFGRVIVANSISDVCRQGHLPEADLDHQAGVCFPRSQAGVTLPFLLLSEELPADRLAAVVTHETMHAVVHYLWELGTVPGAALDAFYLLVTNFIAEIFTQAQTAAVLGAPYLLVPSAARTSCHAPGEAGTATSFGSSDAVAAGDADFREVRAFLETYPCVAARVGLGWGVHEVDVPEIGWSPRLRELATALGPLARELFDDAVLSDPVFEGFQSLLGPSGPCGGMFQAYAQEVGLSWEDREDDIDEGASPSELVD